MAYEHDPPLIKSLRSAVLRKAENEAQRQRERAALDLLPEVLKLLRYDLATPFVSDERRAVFERIRALLEG